MKSDATLLAELLASANSNDRRKMSDGVIINKYSLGEGRAMLVFNHKRQELRESRVRSLLNQVPEWDTNREIEDYKGIKRILLVRKDS